MNVYENMCFFRMRFNEVLMEANRPIHEIEDRARMPRGTINQARETGKISKENLVRFCKFFNCSLDWLFGMKGAVDER